MRKKRSEKQFIFSNEVINKKKFKLMEFPIGTDFNFINGNLLKLELLYLSILYLVVITI